MDAKMRADFINSVAGGQKIPCLSCNTLNDAGSKFCIACGSKLENTPDPVVETEVKPAFSPIVPTSVAVESESDVAKKPEKKIAFNFVMPEVEGVEEPVSIFAQGLPAWDIVPPQIMVRRKAKR